VTPIFHYMLHDPLLMASLLGFAVIGAATIITVYLFRRGQDED